MAVSYVTLYPPGGNSTTVQVVEGSQLHLIYAAMGFSATPSAPGPPVRPDPFPQYVHDDEVGALVADAAVGATDPVVAGLIDNGGSATSEALRAAFVPVDGIGNATGFLGDSITASGNGAGEVGARWPEVVAARSMGRIHWARNAGVGGDNTAQMLTRLPSTVLAYAPRFCVVLGGTNDADAATATAGLQALYTALRAAGVEPIAVTLPPQNTDPGGKACQVNAWIKRCAEAHRITVADIYPALVDPATGQYAAGMSGDGTHLTAAGDDAVAGVVLDAILPLYPAWSPYLAASQVDAANLVPNPLLIDTRVAGDGVTPIPEDPLGWVGFIAGDVTRSMVTRPGVPGRMHELVIPATVTDSSNVPMATVTGADAFPIPVTPGHTIRWALRIQTENAVVNGVKLGASLQINGPNGGYYGFNQSAAGEIADGVWSQDVVVPAGATGARIIWGASAPATPVSTTKVRFGQPTVVDLGVL